MLNNNQKKLIIKLYNLWETDRLHAINECQSITDYIEQEGELTEMKKKLEIEFNISF